MSGRAAIMAMVLGLAACRREEPPPPPDRTLDKLRAEVDRANAGGAVASSPAAEQEDPNQNLAALAAGIATDRGPEGPLPLPSEGQEASAGELALHLGSAETRHQVKGTGMSLTSEELFLRAVVEVRNRGKSVSHVNIERFVVTDGETQWKLARDAQVLAGTRALGFDLTPGEQREVVLMFEVPPSALAGPTLVLSLPHLDGGNGDVGLRLK